MSDGPRTGVHDGATRQRLLDAAGQLFARRGFSHVTVREICRQADTNIAAVNYHFRDKFGLYMAVVHKAIQTMEETNRAAVQAGEAGSAEQRLRAFTSVFLERVAANAGDSRIQQLVSREMLDPTPAFDVIVSQAIRPRLNYLSGVVGQLLGCPSSDERVLRCVASIQSQFLYWLNPRVAKILPGAALTSTSIEGLADHIATFSLAGIRALSRHPSSPSSPAARKGRRHR